MWRKLLKQLDFPESYISITLGFLVVIVSGLLIYNYINKTKTSNQGVGNKKVVLEETAETLLPLPTSHKVVELETLWSIAEKYYGSGYNWVTIAKANGLSNPDKITVGQTLTLPKAEVITPPTYGETSSSATGPETTYTVVRGDNLWNIACRQYSNCYNWTKIASANNLVNPGLIHAGNVLNIPR